VRSPAMGRPSRPSWEATPAPGTSSCADRIQPRHSPVARSCHHSEAACSPIAATSPVVIHDVIDDQFSDMQTYVAFSDPNNRSMVGLARAQT
jgi:hypothetical protein